MNNFTSYFNFDSVIVFVMSVAAGLASLFVLGRAICLGLKMLMDVDVCTPNGIARDAGSNDISVSKPKPKPSSPSNSPKSKDC